MAGIASTAESWLRGTIERVRTWLEEVSLDAKYDDAFLAAHIVPAAMTDVVARVSNTTGSHVVLRYGIPIGQDESETVYHRLPPCVQSVVRLVVMDDGGTILREIVPRDDMDVRGPTWTLEGPPGAMELRLVRAASSELNLEVWYRSNGDVKPHLGVGEVRAAEGGGHEVVMATQPTLGVVDRRPAAYAGQVLRVLPESGPIEEALIEDYRWESPSFVARLRTPLVHHGPPATVTYEVVPSGMGAMLEAVSLWAAIKLGVGRRITQSHHQMLLMQYLAAIKTLGDNLTYVQGRSSPEFRRTGVDDPNLSSLGGVLMR